MVNRRLSAKACSWQTAAITTSFGPQVIFHNTVQRRDKEKRRFERDMLTERKGQRRGPKRDHIEGRVQSGIRIA